MAWDAAGIAVIGWSVQERVALPLSSDAGRR